MIRDVHVDVLNAIYTPEIKAIAMVDLDFESGHVYVNSTDRSISYGGNTFLGVGTLGAIGSVEESSDTKAQGINLELSGVVPETLSIALNENYQGRIGKLFLTFLDANWQVIGDPILIFQGLMDSQNITLGKEGKVSITIENQLAAWEKPNLYLYNNGDQQVLYPGDRGLEFVEQAAEKEISWGA